MPDTLIQLTLDDLILQVPIYTIGYSGRSIDQFFELLHRYAIKFLIDVRSHPHSRFNQQFSRTELEKVAKQQQITYVFMGDTLGGRPNELSCYVDGNVDYSRVREQAFFQQGIDRIQTAWDKQLSVALMCAERKPQECHRSKLIGNTLCMHNITVAHINEAGDLKTQQEINELLLGQQLSLFEHDPDVLMAQAKMRFSRKKYSPSARE